MNKPLGIISKDTILKAIHNVTISHYPSYLLGIISKDTILKAIHNSRYSNSDKSWVGNYK